MFEQGDVNSVRPSIIVQLDEMNDVLDELDICMFALRAESQLVGEYADMLVSLCGDADKFDTPIPGIDFERPNATFRELLALIGADSPEGLSVASGIDVQTCAAVLDNPIGCEAAARHAVVGGLEEASPGVLWGTASNESGESVGERLYLWMRDYFLTPFQFADKAISSAVKSKLIGAVSSLTNSELCALNELDTVLVLKDAAANPARYQCPKSTQ